MCCAPAAEQEMYISETPNTGDTFSTATAIAGQMSYSSDGGELPYRCSLLLGQMSMSY